MILIRSGTPSLITRSTNDIRQIQDMVLMVLRNVISAPLMMIGGVIMSFIMNKRLSMIIFLLLPIIVAIALVIVKKVMPMFDVMQKKTDRLNQVVREKLSGIRVIRAFNRSDYEDGRFGDANRELTGTALRINRMFAALIPVAMMLLYGTIITLVWVGSKQVDSFNPATQAAQIAGTVGNLPGVCALSADDYFCSRNGGFPFYYGAARSNFCAPGSLRCSIWSR